MYVLVHLRNGFLNSAQNFVLETFDGGFGPTRYIKGLLSPPTMRNGMLGIVVLVTWFISHCYMAHCSYTNLWSHSKSLYNDYNDCFCCRILGFHSMKGHYFLFNFYKLIVCKTSFQNLFMDKKCTLIWISPLNMIKCALNDFISLIHLLIPSTAFKRHIEDILFLK